MRSPDHILIKFSGKQVLAKLILRSKFCVTEQNSKRQVKAEKHTTRDSFSLGRLKNHKTPQTQRSTIYFKLYLSWICTHFLKNYYNCYDDDDDDDDNDDDDNDDDDNVDDNCFGY